MIFIRFIPLLPRSHPKISLFPNLIENLLQSLSSPFQTLFLDQNKTIEIEIKTFKPQTRRINETTSRFSSSSLYGIKLIPNSILLFIFVASIILDIKTPSKVHTMNYYSNSYDSTTCWPTINNILDRTNTQSSQANSWLLEHSHIEHDKNTCNSNIESAIDHPDTPKPLSHIYIGTGTHWDPLFINNSNKNIPPVGVEELYSG